MTDSEKLLKLAEWFDISDLRQKGHINDNEVQKTLREIAERIKHHPSEPAETGVAEEILKDAAINIEWSPLHKAVILKAMTTYAEKRCAEKDGEIIDGEWKLIGHSYQIADTGDYDGHYEITNGKISILTNDDDDESLKPIVNALNRSGIKFWQDDAAEFENKLFRDENKELRSDLSEANKRIESIDSHRSRLIESVKKWGGAWRKCRAELKEAKRRIAELECQSKDSRNLNSEFYKCNVCGNTPAVIVFTDKGTFCKEHAEYK